MVNKGKTPRESTHAIRVSNVNYVVNTSGTRTDELLITIEHPNRGPLSFVLPMQHFMQSSVDKTGLILLKNGLLRRANPSEVRATAMRLLGQAQGDVYVIARDGHHKFRVGKREFECYVFGGELHWISALTSERAKVIPYTSGIVAPSCDTAMWSKKLGRYARKNPYLLFACCAALTGYVASLLQLPTATLSIVGPSSTGKTVLLRFVQSLYASGESIAAATGTLLGLRVLLEEHPHQPLMLDELRQVTNVAELTSLLFDLANHAGRKTSSANQQLNASAELSAMVISANERSIAELLPGKRALLDEGVSARLFELGVEGTHGVFHGLPKGLNAAEFADRIKARSLKYYGAVAPRFVLAVASDANRIKKNSVPRVKKLLTVLAGDEKINDVTKRLLHAVAGWMYVGEVAVDRGLLPVTSEQLQSAFKLVVGEYLRRQANGLTPIGERVVAKVRELIDAQGHRFLPFGQRDEKRSQGLLGYTKTVKGHGECFLILPTLFDSLVGSEFGTRAAVAALRAAGYLVTDQQGDQYQVRMSKGDTKRKRFYAISAAIRLDGN